MARHDKTNAMRLLEQRKVAYQALTYSPELHSALEVAEALGVPAEIVYKTLVVLRERGRPLLVMIAGPREVDMRRLARSLDEKSVKLAPQREAERLTGLQVGGIGALALLNKPFDVCLDREALQHGEVLVNGGRRGLNLRLRVDDLVAVTGALMVDAVATTEAPSA